MKEKDLLMAHLLLLSKSKEETKEEEPSRPELKYDREFTIVCPDCDLPQIITKKMLKGCYDESIGEESPWGISIYFGGSGGWGFITFHCNHCGANQRYGESD